MSPSQMQQASHVQVVNKNLYSQDGTRKAVPHGVLDHKMVTWVLALSLHNTLLYQNFSIIY